MKTQMQTWNEFLNKLVEEPGEPRIHFNKVTISLPSYLTGFGKWKDHEPQKLYLTVETYPDDEDRDEEVTYVEWNGVDVTELIMCIMDPNDLLQ